MPTFKVEVDAVITKVVWVDALGCYDALEKAVKVVDDLDLPELFEIAGHDVKRWSWQACEAEEIIYE